MKNSSLTISQNKEMKDKVSNHCKNVCSMVN